MKKSDFIDSFIRGFDRHQLCSDLEEWYEGTENINLDDFPDVLRPYMDGEDCIR